MKRLFLIVLLLLLNSCISKYKTGILFEDGNYKYTVDYPNDYFDKWKFYNDTLRCFQLEPDNWELFKYGEATIIKSKYLNNFFHSTDKKYISIEIFIFNKNNKIEKKFLEKLLKNNYTEVFYLNLLDLKNKQIMLENMNNWYDKNGNNKMLRINIEAENNKIILIDLWVGDIREVKKILKDISEIMGSINMEKIETNNIY